MGVYLSKPVKEKISSTHENGFLKCGASSMQGWRMSQEDAHNCCLDFDSEVSLFAVYDGHGGAEVADLASKRLPNIIRQTKAYLAGQYDQALKDAFLSFDASLVTEPVLEELKKIAGSKDQSNNAASETDEENAEEEDDVQGLREEAKMPLPDVIARYANGTIPKTPALKRIVGESSKSPYLRARPPSNLAEGDVSSSGSKSGASGPCPSSTSEAEGGGSPGEATPSDAPTSTSDEGGGGAASSSSSAPLSAGSSEIGGSDQVTSGGSGAGKEGSAALTNGEVHSNGEIPDASEDAVGSTSGKEAPVKSEEGSCGAVSSSSCEVNGEGGSPKKRITGTGRLSAEKARQKMFRSLLAAVSAEDDDSESDENDENFSASVDNSLVQSSDDDEEEGEGGDEEAEEEEEEEDEEEEDEEDGDEEVDLVEESDDVEEPGKDSGCTAVVSLVTKDRVIVANAGDSRAVLCRGGEAVDLSVDHKPEDPLELARITAAGGRVTSDGRVNGGLNLSRALGDHMYKKTSNLPATEQMITALPDIKSIDLNENEDEFIVLACDGIWNSMSSQEVVDFVRPLIAKGEKLSEICEKLFDNCLAEHTLGDGTGCDNMTCVIVQLFPQSQSQGNKRKSEETPNADEVCKKVKVDNDGGET